MKHECIRRLIAAISLILIAVNAPTLAARQSQPRAADPYDERTFVIQYGNWQPDAIEKAEEIKTQAREFIWASWRQKRPAHCIINSTYLKDKTDIFHYYIGPDASGRWQALIKSERNYSLDPQFAAQEAEMRRVLEKPFRTVQRRETVPMEGRRLIGDDENPKPRTYELWFADRDGKSGQATEIVVF